jgi:hypothetical protein
MTHHRLMPTNYAPYDTFPAFDRGIDDYMSGRFENPYCDPRQGLAAQAWDRGSEYAMRVVRHDQADALAQQKAALTAAGCGKSIPRPRPVNALKQG